jgi:hypothetical protein
MSCPLNRNRFKGSGVEKQGSTEGSKQLDSRLSEMLALRSAQDCGDWKTRPSWSPLPVAIPEKGVVVVGSGVGSGLDTVLAKRS